MASQLASYRPSSIVIAISHPQTNTSHIIGGMSNLSRTLNIDIRNEDKEDSSSGAS